MSHSEWKMSFVPSVIPPSEPCGSALWFVFYGDRLLVTVKDRAVSPIRVRDLGELGLEPIRQHYLGTLDGRDCYSAELSGRESKVGSLKGSEICPLFLPLCLLVLFL